MRSLIEIVGVTPSFIKKLEETELIFPIFEEDEPFYTERDIRKLFLAKDLEEMGINFAGIEVILEISERMFEIRRETDEVMYRLFKYIDKNISEEKY
ncbi:MAG: MerR family transcriptional regulator [Deltaproteobacteria bacterium]|nr:MerR family transcriptional regulator [Deltaproteobacteria bacterium]